MNFGQSFKLALNSLRTSKMRAFLTMLGIIIGVGAVIVILSLGNGMTNMMNEQFETLGSNLIQVMVWPRGEGGTRDVDADDLYELVDQYPQYLSGVSPYVSASAKVRSGTDTFDRTSVYGVSESFFKSDTQKTMQGETLEEGRFLRYIDVDRRQNVCVIGSYLEQEAFRGDALGKSLSISGVPYTVVGILEQSADNTEGSGDDKVYIPYENAQRLLGGAAYQDMYLMTEDGRQWVSITVDKVTDGKTAIDMDAFLTEGIAQATAAYESIDGMEDVTSAAQTTSFLGSEYSSILTTAVYNGFPARSLQVCIPVEQYICVVTFTSYVEDHTDEMMGFFSAIQK